MATAWIEISVSHKSLADDTHSSQVKRTMHCPWQNVTNALIATVPFCLLFIEKAYHHETQNGSTCFKIGLI
ncbi:hypothetical protein V1477_018247 [Vespula maculifrons]|uniref:Uncharacterized protein n=1 Tax=Vespula maculifrons TaxID=7453 RepID=A0ABD2AYX1_VESMC